MQELIKKMMKNNLIRNFFIISLLLFSIEFIFRLVSNINVFSLSIFRIILGIIFISMLLSFMISWFSKKISEILIVVFSFIFSFYAFLQLGFNDFIGVYASFNQTSQLGAVTEYVKDFFSSFNLEYYLIFLPFLILVLLYWNKNKRVIISIDKNYKPLKKCLITFSILLFSGMLYYVSIVSNVFLDELQMISNRELFKYPSHASLAVNQFGVIGYGISDVRSLFDSDFKKYINEKEKEERLNTITDYLKKQDKTTSNEYTGLFANKNVIVILLESVNEIIINKELYPNFYKLYNEGFSFVNNYSPRNSCSTGNNELSALTSLYTISTNCTCNVYQDNTYFESLFNLFNNKGYNTYSMHNYDDTYYARKIIHPNLGSNKYYGAEELEIEFDKKNENWASDEDLVNKAMDIVLEDNNKPFMLYMASVTSHQPYTVSSIYGDKYLDLFKKDDYAIELKRYMSKLKTLDNALGLLIDRLKKAKVLDDTVIVMFGDHYPYALKNDTINSVLEYDLNEYEVERTPFVIYNSKEHPKIIKNYTSFINLTPTLANLFALDYDARLYMGSDIFSDNYLNVVTFTDGSWKNDIAYYDASKAKVKYYKEDIYSTDDIIKINKIVKDKMQISKSIIENNYFAYLQNNLYLLEREENK